MLENSDRKKNKRGKDGVRVGKINIVLIKCSVPFTLMQLSNLSWELLNGGYRD